MSRRQKQDLELEQLKDLASDSDADFYESETEAGS